MKNTFRNTTQNSSGVDNIIVPVSILTIGAVVLFYFYQSQGDDPVQESSEEPFVEEPFVEEPFVEIPFVDVPFVEIPPEEEPPEEEPKKGEGEEQRVTQTRKNKYFNVPNALKAAGVIGAVAGTTYGVGKYMHSGQPGNRETRVKRETTNVPTTGNKFTPVNGFTWQTNTHTNATTTDKSQTTDKRQTTNVPTIIPTTGTKFTPTNGFTWQTNTHTNTTTTDDLYENMAGNENTIPTSKVNNTDNLPPAIQKLHGTNVDVRPNWWQRWPLQSYFHGNTQPPNQILGPHTPNTNVLLIAPNGIVGSHSPDTNVDATQNFFSNNPIVPYNNTGVFGDDPFRNQDTNSTLLNPLGLKFTTRETPMTPQQITLEINNLKQLMNEAKSNTDTYLAGALSIAGTSIYTTVMIPYAAIMFGPFSLPFMGTAFYAIASAHTAGLIADISTKNREKTTMIASELKKVFDLQNSYNKLSATSRHHKDFHSKRLPSLTRSKRLSQNQSRKHYVSNQEFDKLMAEHNTDGVTIPPVVRRSLKTYNSALHKDETTFDDVSRKSEMMKFNEANRLKSKQLSPWVDEQLQKYKTRFDEANAPNQFSKSRKNRKSSNKPTKENGATTPTRRRINPVGNSTRRNNLLASFPASNIIITDTTPPELPQKYQTTDTVKYYESKYENPKSYYTAAGIWGTATGLGYGILSTGLIVGAAPPIVATYTGLATLVSFGMFASNLLYASYAEDEKANILEQIKNNHKNEPQTNILEDNSHNEKELSLASAPATKPYITPQIFDSLAAAKGYDMTKGLNASQYKVMIEECKNYLKRHSQKT